MVNNITKEYNTMNTNTMPESKMNLRKGENQMIQRYDEIKWTADKMERFRKTADKLNSILRDNSFGVLPIYGVKGLSIDSYGCLIQDGDTPLPKIKESQGGYKYVNVTLTNGKRRAIKLHLLVVMAIIGNTKYKHYLRLLSGRRTSRYSLTVDHINGDKQDNSVANLQILTSCDNSAKVKRSNNTGERGIFKWINKNNGKIRFFVNISVNGRRFSYNYDTMEKAIAKRNELINFIS